MSGVRVAASAALSSNFGLELPFSVKDLMRHWNW
jgi:hypothetical protein